MLSLTKQRRSSDFQRNLYSNFSQNPCIYPNIFEFSTLHPIFSAIFRRILGDFMGGPWLHRRRGDAPSGGMVILHFGSWRSVLVCVYAHLAIEVPVSPIDKSLK